MNSHLSLQKTPLGIQLSPQTFNPPNPSPAPHLHPPPPNTPTILNLPPPRKTKTIAIPQHTPYSRPSTLSPKIMCKYETSSILNASVGIYSFFH